MAKKNASLQIVARTEQEKLDKIEAVNERRRQEDDSLTLSTDEARALLHEFIDRIDQTLAEVCFQFENGLEGSQNWSRGRCPMDFIEQLHPWLKNYERRVRAALEKIETQGDPETQDLDGDNQNIKWTHEETGYQLGILVGARLAGYSPKKVRKMAEYLVDTLR